MAVSVRTKGVLDEGVQRILQALSVSVWDMTKLIFRTGSTHIFRAPFNELMLWLVFQNVLDGHVVVPINSESLIVYTEYGEPAYEIAKEGDGFVGISYVEHLDADTVYEALLKLLDGVYTLSVFLASTTDDSYARSALVYVAERLAAVGAKVDSGFLELFEEVLPRIRSKVYLLNSIGVKAPRGSAMVRGGMPNVEFIVADHTNPIIQKLQIHFSDPMVYIELELYSYLGAVLVVSFGHRYFRTPEPEVGGWGAVDFEEVASIASRWKDIVREAIEVLKKRGEAEIAGFWEKILSSLGEPHHEVP